MLLHNIHPGFVVMHAKRTQLAIEIPCDLHTRLKVLAASRGISLRGLVLPAFDQIVTEASKARRDSETKHKAR